ncbi:MAG: hypothetical protein ABIA92_05035 [Patescibacteria group bacterium]
MHKKRSTADLVPYKCSKDPLRGTQLKVILPQARKIFRSLEKRTKRKPYIRSRYFNKDKIFFDYFWSDLKKKIPSERARRLKLLPCALEVLRYSRHEPLTIDDMQDSHLLRHRFAGRTQNGLLFYVQVKQNKRTGTKQFLSVFPSR